MHKAGGHDAPRIMPIAPWHLLFMQAQPSQLLQVGTVTRFGPVEAADKVAAGEGYAVVHGTRVAACFGIIDTYPGRHGLAWAILAQDMGIAHLTLTRFARAAMAASPLRRIEAVAAAPAGTTDLAEMLRRPSPEMRWAMMVGMQPVHVLREFGGLSETMVLLERIAA